MSSSLRHRLACLPIAFAALAVTSLSTGCGLGTATSNQALDGVTLKGTVHGGQQPVTGSTIQLYAVGNAGYGSAATSLLTSATTTDANGAFNITAKYTCPSATSLVYMTATGGNPGLPGAAVNLNLKELALLGQCGNLTAATNIAINEVTTVAGAFALTPYFTTTFGTASTDSFGAPAAVQAQTGIRNAFTTAATLANSSTGAANSTLTTNGAGGTITITPEASKIFTIADILAACVNSAGGTAGDGTACGTLFADSGPAGTTPTDTLQAAVLLNRNPTSTNANGSANNLTALYNLITAAAPYTAQASQPTDWTVGVQYTGTAATMALPLGLQIDSTGNVWVVNNNGGAGGSLNEINPAGVMLVNSPLAATVNGTATSAVATNPRNLAIDLNDNIWVPTSSGSAYLFEYTTGGTVNALAVGGGSYGIAIDGNNNVFVGESSSAPTYSFVEFTGATLSAANQISYTTAGAATSRPSYMAFDANNNLWASSGANIAAATNLLELTAAQITACGTTTPCTPTYNNVTGTGTQPFGLAATATALISANASGNNLSTVSIGTTPAVTNFASATSVNAPRFPAVDGVGNIWVSNRGSGAISEFTGAGAVLSPVATTTTTNGTTTTTPLGFAHNGLGAANQVAIDPSGNIWAADNTLTAPNANSIFQIVGAAAPAVSPNALALKNSTIGTRP